MRVIPDSTLFTGKSHRVLYRSLSTTVKEMRPDIIYVNAEPESFLAWQAVTVRANHHPEAKVVIDSWRNMDYPTVGYPYRFAWLHARIEKLVRERAEHCVAHTGTGKATLQMDGFKDITVIPPAVDMEMFRPEKDHTGGNAGPFTIGFVGRFIPEKGLDLLLRAAATLPFEYRLLLVGDGPAMTECARLASHLNISDRVVWHGKALHSDVPLLLRQMHAVVLPSRTGVVWKEQFGRILIEAMAVGVPVIGSTSGEIPRVIGDAGLTFAEQNVEDLREQIVRLHEDGEARRRLVAKALQRVSTLYAVPVVAQGYADLFNDLADRM